MANKISKRAQIKTALGKGNRDAAMAKAKALKVSEATARRYIAFFLNSKPAKKAAPAAAKKVAKKKAK